jgi:hypothetical protein
LNTAQEIYDLAHQRLEEAKVLLENGMCDGAFYLAGYSVELMLKWKICKSFSIDNLYSIDQPSMPLIEGVKELKSATKIHNLYTLLLFSGLRSKFDEEKDQNQNLFKTNSLLMSVWNENVRYKPCGTFETNDVRTLLELLSNEETGFLKWIENN